MNLIIEFNQEDDGKWSAGISKLHRCEIHGAASKEEAHRKVQAYAFEKLAKLLEINEIPALTSIRFTEGI